MNTNPNVKRILVFGDSNTWGRVPGEDNSARYPANVRWTGVLQNLLGDGFEVIEEGLNGRTVNLDSPHKAGKNGKEYLFSCLESQKPIDYLVLSLGKNDLKYKYGATSQSVGEGIRQSFEVINKEARNNQGEIPAVILVVPALIIEKERERFGKVEVDFLGAASKSKELVEVYKKIAEENGAVLVNLQEIVEPSEVDGVHLEAVEHEKIGKKMFEVITDLDKH